MHGQAAIAIRLDRLVVPEPIGGIHQVPWAVQALRRIIAAGTIALGTVATTIGMPQLVAGSCRITTTTHRAPQAAQAPIGKTRQDQLAVMGPRPTATCVIERATVQATISIQWGPDARRCERPITAMACGSGGQGASGRIGSRQPVGHNRALTRAASQHRG
jgi:hypothetical protein